MLGEVAAAAKIVAAAAEGYGALKRLQPEYGRFWKHFESELKPQSADLPWDRLKGLRIDPDFVGEACGLIRGDHDKRKAMRVHIARLAVPPEKGRYDSGEIVERVMRVADDSAVAAARDDRDVAAQRGRLIEGRLDEMEENFSRQLRELREAMTRAQPPPSSAWPEPLRGTHRREQSSIETTEALEEFGAPSPIAGRRAVREAERKLERILAQDPGVRLSIKSSSPGGERLHYQPDFAVRDREGNNWYIEIKDDSALTRHRARAQVRETAELTKRASRELPDKWQFLLLTPASLQKPGNWPEVRANAPELADL